jgi:hypothetical protein
MLEIDSLLMEANHNKTEFYDPCNNLKNRSSIRLYTSSFEKIFLLEKMITTVI